MESTSVKPDNQSRKKKTIRMRGMCINTILNIKYSNLIFSTIVIEKYVDIVACRDIEIIKHHARV